MLNAILLVTFHTKASRRTGDKVQHMENGRKRVPQRLLCGASTRELKRVEVLQTSVSSD